MCCCGPVGSELPERGRCSDCSGPVDIDGNTTEACGYSTIECETCGYAPCNQSC